MCKPLCFLQTLALACLPMLLSGFNLSFAFPDDHLEALSCEHSHDAFCHDGANVAFGSEMAKVIKERLDRKDSYRIKTIVLDAGHGGKDPGCLGSHSREKHIALGIVLHLGQQIEAAYPDVRVIYTRKTDEFIPLHERASIANRNNADIFISVHCNYIRKASFVNGSETYVMGLHRAEENLEVAKRENSAILLEENYEKNYGDFDPNSNEGHIILSMFQNAYLDQSIFLAERIESRIASSAQRHSRGVKQAGFLVLRETTMPSVLVEAGFLSHSQEEAYLNDPIGQQQMAQALFEAFQDYKNAVESPGYSNSFQYAPQQLDAEESVSTMPVASAPAIVWDTPQPKTTQQKSGTATQQPARAQKVNNYQVEEEEDPILQDLRAMDAANQAKERTSIPVSTTVIPVSEPSTATPKRPNTEVSAESAPKTSSNTTNQTVKEPLLISDKSINNATFHQPAAAASTQQAKSPAAAQPQSYAQNSSILKPELIQFRVQLAASPTILNTSSEKWKNLSYLIEIIQEDKLYKYQVRNLSSFEEASKAKDQLQQDGFKDAFIVAYDGKKRVDITEAIQAVGQK